jgi:hypothetical protein
MSGGDILVMGTIGVLFLGAMVLAFFDKEAREQRRRDLAPVKRRS